MNKMIERRIDRDLMDICKDRKKIAKIICRNFIWLFTIRIQKIEG